MFIVYVYVLDLPMWPSG